jgi:superfamily II DNA or RNA helicase
MSSDLKQKLEILYAQKEEIEQEIKKIELTLSQNFSTDDKIEIFYETFFKSYNPNISKGDIKNHLLGNTKLIYDESTAFRYSHIMFCINKTDLPKIQTLLLKKSIIFHYEYPTDEKVNCWCFFEYEYDLSMYERIKYSLQKVFSNIQVEFFKKYSFALNLKDIQHNKRLFIDANTSEPYNPQWSFLKNIKKTTHYSILGLLDKSINIVLDENIHIPNSINFQILNELKQILTFENPIYQTLLRLRKPIYNTPKFIKNFTQTKGEFIISRGLKDTLLKILKFHHQEYNIIDNRFYKHQVQFNVKFQLRPNQQIAVEKLSSSDYGVCVAPPGFGKTLIGAKMIELRECNTLILVNKNMLLDQWIQRLSDYFGVSNKEFGILGKSKNSLNHKLDIATIQSIKNNEDIMQEYSFLIIDECHHIPAYSFETLIKKFKGRYILGLSATPHRKDGLEPLLFHQVGAIVYEESPKAKHKNQIVKLIESDFITNAQTYTEILGELINDKKRNDIIIEQVIENKHRNIILLSDRVEHIEILESLLREKNVDFVTIHGSQTKKEQNANQAVLTKSPLILSSSAYFGEGVDLEHLDTIIFATPISYYGRIIQYLGRVGRGSDITDTLCIDILDSHNPILLSTYKKRKEGFIKLGYKIINIPLN